ncbi:MAG: CBS domain-containing protein [Saprospiraceae bacterium]|jgi:CBS domain-containing protein
MVSPVITVAPEMTVADIQIMMVKRKIHHLCVTVDGTIETPVIGVISDHDMLVIQANNPAILIREISRAKNGKSLAVIRDKAEILLKKYIYQEVNIMFISTILSEINDAIIVRANQLAEEQLAAGGIKKPDVKFCWLGLGSEGRREQLLRTDQDNALIFENVEDDQMKAVKSYFVNYSKIVTGILNVTGFIYCPANMMASNPDWCLSLNEWKANFATWINSGTNAALLHSNIFFDYRPIYGSIELAEQLTNFIFEELEGKTIFFARLAKNAQENPAPLTFFRNFVVERNGVHKDKFDIKARVMMPLADAARVLMLHNRVRGVNNTVRRFQKMAEIEPRNKDLYNQAADAYEIFMRYRALQGLRDMNTGRYFDPAELNKLERMNLRNSFKPIDEIQTLLKMRFQTLFLG